MIDLISPLQGSKLFPSTTRGGARRACPWLFYDAPAGLGVSKCLLLRFRTLGKMGEQRHGSHPVSRLAAHLVWVRKCRYHVLRGDVQQRCCELINQICNAEDVGILKGVVSKVHGHMLIEYPPSNSISDLTKRFNGRTARRLQEEFPVLRKQYRGDISGPSGTGYRAGGTSQKKRSNSIWSITTTRQIEKRKISFWGRTISTE
jgi:putative transposase